MDGDGVSHDKSGHLDLDDMGNIVEGKLPLEVGETATTEVLEGLQDVTWGERLESAGVTPYLRRHRVLTRIALVGLAVVGMVAGGASAYLSSRPPADDGAIAVTTWWGDASLTEQGTVELQYYLSPKRSGDSLRLLELVGPGVRASAGSEQVTKGTGTTGEHHLAVIPGCDDPAVITAKDGDYHLLMQRTDRLGRSVTGLVDITVGSSVRWPSLISSACTRQWFDEAITAEAVDVSTTSPAEGVPTLELGLHLHSDFGSDIAAAYRGGFGYFWGGVPPARTPNSGLLAAGQTTLLPVSVPVLDCRSPSQALASGGVTGLELTGMIVTPTSGTFSGDIIVGELDLRWSEPVAARIAGALRSLCAGAPLVTVDVVSATPATNVELSAPLNANGPVVAVLRTRLLVTSDATRVTVSDTATAAEVAQGTPVYVTTRTADLSRGLGEVTVDWATTCDAQMGPPMVQLQLASGRHRYPAQVTLADPNLTTGFLQACGLVTTTDLTSSGWPSPG